MLSPTSTVRTGRYPETIDGAGLDASGLQALRDERANAAALGEAIREAMQRARVQGLSAFAPDSGILQVPSVPLDDLRVLFATVLRVPYSKTDKAPGLPEYGPLSPEEWSRAEATLALQVARADSMLPPGAGGGPQYARGQWYVDGESYTTAELFLTIRLGNLGNLDQQLATDLNTMTQNTQLARQLLAVLADMKRRSELREADAAADSQLQPTYDSDDDFAEFVEAAGLTVAAVFELGLQFRGAGSYLAKVGNAALANAATTSSDYDDAMKELQALFDSINTENDVKQVRVDSLQNQRMTVLVGLSAYLSSTLAQTKTVERNL